MKTKGLLVLVALFAGANASAQEMTALSCKDFRPTNEVIERFPNLVGACEGIVERNGELYGLFRAVVRRVSGNNVTLHLPATGKTFTTRPDPSMRVLVDGKKTRARDLRSGQEIRIYLSSDEFSKPDIEEVAFITEEDFVVDVAVEDVAGSKTVQVPGKVVTSTVRSMAIVEAVDKETRELKLIDVNGKRYTVVASDLVANFDQIEPRDRIVMEYLESVAVFAVPAGAPELGDAATVEVAPLGNKPGIKTAETVMVKATVQSLNMTDRIAVLRGENGQLRTVKISDDVPLDLIKVGDEVRMRINQGACRECTQGRQELTRRNARNKATADCGRRLFLVVIILAGFAASLCRAHAAQ